MHTILSLTQTSALKRTIKPLMAGTLVVASTVALLACNGNDTTTTQLKSLFVTPTQVDKEIVNIGWTPGDEDVMASYAYRAVANNSIMAAIYSGQPSVLTAFINLAKTSAISKCNVSGSKTAEQVAKICYNSATIDAANEVPCFINGEANGAVKKDISAQKSQFFQCQNGITQGEYFDGALVLETTNDSSVIDRYTEQSKFSALGQKNKIENGKLVLDTNDQPVKVDINDFQFQNESYTLFFSNEYTLEKTFNTDIDRFVGLEACTERDILENTNTGTKTKLGTSKVLTEKLALPSSGNKWGVFQQPEPIAYEYSEFEGFELEATPTYSCEDVDGVSTLKLTRSYELKNADSRTATISSKTLGTDNTLSWTGLKFTTDVNTNERQAHGILTIAHTNPAPNNTTPVIVTADFDTTPGSVIISVDGVVKPSMGSSLADFLMKSKAPVAQP